MGLYLTDVACFASEIVTRCCLLHSQSTRDPKSRGGSEWLFSLLHLNDSNKNVAFSSSNFEIHWFGQLSLSRENVSPRGHKSGLTELEDKSATCHFGHLMSPNQQAWENGVNLLAEVIILDYQGEIELLLHNGTRKTVSDTRSGWGPLGHLLVLPYLTVKVNEKPQQSKRAEWWGVKVWVTPLCEKCRAVEVLAEGKGNIGWAGEGSHRSQLWSHDWLQKWRV